MSNQEDHSLSLLINSRDFNKKVQAILRESKTLDIHGDDLNLSLLTSGAVMGLELAQRNFKENTAAVVALLRKCITKLEALILSTEDEDVINQVSTIRREFSNILQTRSKELYETYVSYIEDSFKLDRMYISDKFDIDTCSRVELQKVGFTVYSAAPIYFFAWNHFRADGRLKKFKCHCHSCMLGHLQMEPATERDNIDAAIDAAGGIDKLFRLFGEFVLAAIKQLLESLSYGEMGHDEDIVDPQTQAKDLFKALQIVKGREAF